MFPTCGTLLPCVGRWFSSASSLTSGADQRRFRDIDASIAQSSSSSLARASVDISGGGNELVDLEDADEVEECTGLSTTMATGWSLKSPSELPLLLNR